MTDKDRIIKLEEVLEALLKNFGKEAVWKKEKTGVADNPFRERAVVLDKKSG